MRDSNLVLRASGAGNLTATANLTAIDIGKGGYLNEVAWQVYVPSVSGTNPTLDVFVQFSDDNFTTVHEQAEFPQITAAGTYEMNTIARRRYVRARVVIGGTGSPNFGATVIQATSGMGQTRMNVANA